MIKISINCLMEELIKKTYLDPELGATSTNKLFYKLKDKGVTLKDVKDFFEETRNTTNLY